MTRGGSAKGVLLLRAGNGAQQLAIRNLTDSKRINDYLCVSPCTPRQTTPIDLNTL